MAKRTGAIRAGRAFVELFADDSMLVRGLRRAQYKLRRFGRSVSQLGRKLLGLATAIMAPIGLGVREYARFEEQLARVSTMVDDTAAHMGRFRQALGAMATEFGVSTEALASGLYDILSAQVPVSKALDVLREGTRSAIGGFTDAKTSTSALITILSAYGDQLRDAADASDFLFAVVKRGRLTYEDLASNLGKVAPTAAAVGVSVEEFGAALALITRGMPDVENATTALANIIETFMKNTADAKVVAKGLGIEMSTAGIRADGLLYVIKQLARVDPDTVAKVFPRRRALRGLIIAVQKAEELGIDIAGMTNRAGEAEKAYEKMAHTPLRELARLWEAVKRLGRTIGAAIGDTVKKLSIDLKALVSSVADWVSRNQELVAALIKVVLIVGAAGAALMLLGAAISVVGFVLGGLAAMASVLGAAFAALGVLIGALVSPVALVIAAVAAFGVYLLDITGAGAKALKWLGARFEALKETALVVLAGIKDALVAGDIGLAARILWLTLKAAWQRGIQPLKTMWHKFVFGIQASWEIAVHGIVRAWDWAAKTIRQVWADLKAFFMRSFEKIVAFLGGIMAHVVAAFAKDVSAADLKKQLAEQSKDRLAAIESERSAAKGAAEDEYQARRKSEESLHRERMRNISREHSEQIAATEAELKKAREEWRAAVDEAKLRAVRAGEIVSAHFTAVEGPSDRIRKMISGAETAAAGVRGTFSAWAAWGLGAGGVQDRIAAATERTAVNTDRLLDKAGQPAFGD